MGASSSTPFHWLTILEQISQQRRTLWPRLLGADVRRRQHPRGYFRALSSLPPHALSPPARRDLRRIAVDVPRLCAPPSRHAACAQVVSAFTLHQLPPGGYLPAAALLAAALLDALDDAEAAFWCLCALVDAPHLFGGRVFGQPDFAQIVAFSHAVAQRLPQLARHMAAGGRAAFFDGQEHGLTALGAARWIGTLFAHGGGDNRLCHACIDACCVFGVEAAHLLALELLRRAEPRILRASELEDVLDAPRAAEAEVSRSAAAMRQLMLGAFSSRAARKQMHLTTQCSLRQQEAACAPHRFRACVFASESRRWSVEMHPLCSEEVRSAVRAVLMLHRRDPRSSLFARLPYDLLIVRVLGAIALA